MKPVKMNYFVFALALVMTFPLLAGGSMMTSSNRTNTESKIENICSQDTRNPTQAVVYEDVEMRQYEGYPEYGIDGYRYVHDVRTNHTDKKIVSSERGMMAFDRSGNPLTIGWNGLDSGSEPSYFFLFDWDESEIFPHQTEDILGGWTLNESGTDGNAEKIAFVIYCDKEITFEDGTVWTNPDFKDWRTTYEGKKIDVDILEGYYPFEQKISF